MRGDRDGQRMDRQPGPAPEYRQLLRRGWNPHRPPATGRGTIELAGAPGHARIRRLPRRRARPGRHDLPGRPGPRMRREGQGAWAGPGDGEEMTQRYAQIAPGTST